MHDPFLSLWNPGLKIHKLSNQGFKELSARATVYFKAASPQLCYFSKLLNFCLLLFRVPVPHHLMKLLPCVFWDSIYTFMAFTTVTFRLSFKSFLQKDSTADHIHADFILWLWTFQDTIYIISIIYDSHLFSNKLEGNFRLHQKRGVLKRRDYENRLCHSVAFIRLSLGDCQPLMFQLASAETHVWQEGISPEILRPLTTAASNNREL